MKITIRTLTSDVDNFPGDMSEEVIEISESQVSALFSENWAEVQNGLPVSIPLRREMRGAIANPGQWCSTGMSNFVQTACKVVA